MGDAALLCGVFGHHSCRLYSSLLGWYSLTGGVLRLQDAYTYLVSEAVFWSPQTPRRVTQLSCVACLALTHSDLPQPAGLLEPDRGNTEVAMRMYMLCVCGNILQATKSVSAMPPAGSCIRQISAEGCSAVSAMLS